MKKEDDKELEVFLEDLKLDGINITELLCNSKEHKIEHCGACKFFESCPFPKNK